MFSLNRVYFRYICPYRTPKFATPIPLELMGDTAHHKEYDDLPKQEEDRLIRESILSS